MIRHRMRIHRIRHKLRVADEPASAGSDDGASLGGTPGSSWKKERFEEGPRFSSAAFFRGKDNAYNSRFRQSG